MRRTLEYADSVSFMTRSYSSLADIFCESVSLIRASRSVKICRSFWILSFSSCSTKIYKLKKGFRGNGWIWQR